MISFKYFIFEIFLKTINLADLISKNVFVKKPFSIDTILSYSSQILNGLQYLHSKNIVHKNITPS